MYTGGLALAESAHLGAIPGILPPASRRTDVEW
jgi:hypothetical protein